MVELRMDARLQARVAVSDVLQDAFLDAAARLDGWLLPEALGAAVEVTKPSKPSRQRAARRSGDQLGRNASECRAGLETFHVGADPALTWGRLPSLRNRARLEEARPPAIGLSEPAGVMTTACLDGETEATREAPRGESPGHNWTPVRVIVRRTGVGAGAHGPPYGFGSSTSTNPKSTPCPPRV
jgi:hypothetical protein